MFSSSTFLSHWSLAWYVNGQIATQRLQCHLLKSPFLLPLIGGSIFIMHQNPTYLDLYLAFLFCSIGPHNLLLFHCFNYCGSRLFLNLIRSILILFSFRVLMAIYHNLNTWGIIGILVIMTLSEISFKNYF